MASPQAARNSIRDIESIWIGWSGLASSVVDHTEEDHAVVVGRVEGGVVGLREHHQLADGRVGKEREEVVDEGVGEGQEAVRGGGEDLGARALSFPGHGSLRVFATLDPLSNMFGVFKLAEALFPPQKLCSPLLLTTRSSLLACSIAAPPRSSPAAPLYDLSSLLA